MRTKLTLLVALGMIVLVGGGVIADNARDRLANTPALTDAEIQRPEGQMQAEPGNGQQVVPQLEPGIAEIEAMYLNRMQTLKSQLNLATTEEERDVIQQQARQLKVEWTLALADRQLELARERGDTEAETELLAAKQAILNPPSAERVQVKRDPNAGITVEGGAK